MNIDISQSKSELGQKAGDHAARLIREELQRRGAASIIVATGASQFDTLAALTRAPDVDWSRVTIFHLDEYVEMAPTHPASFRRYLQERLIDQLPAAPRAFHAIDGEGDALAECERLNTLIEGKNICVACIGIGENAHLAFNDPPADFATETPFLVVELDEACRAQQLGEGWFASLEEVPRRAISMSIRQIMKAREIVCSVPDERKARAVKGAVEGEVSPDVPASMLQQHPRATLYLDAPAASLLDR
ncbi:MAG: glucosamine-6-phosphate deaminase [Armatimonadetes bacterium]|nr:glucosamine-6-phosphate deaminase [Armatimonadota bacterium]